MKILKVTSLEIPDAKVIRFQRFGDERGYFTEVYRRGDLDTHPETPFLKNVSFTQMNESRSVKGVIKGLHFQWNPYMNKLVRVSRGRMIDLFLDIRKKSPTFGKIGAYDMPSHESDDWNEWIWIPVGFAHGNFYTEDTTIEYMCTGQWAPTTEKSISPFAPDIDWSLVNTDIKKIFDDMKDNQPIVTEKDKTGLTLDEWVKSSDSDNFIFSNNRHES